MKSCQQTFKSKLVMQIYALWWQNATSVKQNITSIMRSPCLQKYEPGRSVEGLNSYQTEEIITYIFQDQRYGSTECVAPCYSNIFIHHTQHIKNGCNHA